MPIYSERIPGVAERPRPNDATLRKTTASRSGRGFASMDPDRQREIASKGGKAAHRKGTAHQWSADEARAAGRKGGTAVSRDRAHMSHIGRRGGAASQRKLQRRAFKAADTPS